MEENLKILLLTDAFFPYVNSASVQLYDLTEEFINQGHSVDVVTPKYEENTQKIIHSNKELKILRFNLRHAKDKNKSRRLLSEIMMSFMAMWCLRKELNNYKYDLIVWYSPSIFWGPLVYFLKRKYKCHTYLILRDIFPEWAYEVGILKNKFAYTILKIVARFQYVVADRIGIQSEGNITYFKDEQKFKQKVEVLNNWLSPQPHQASSLVEQINKISAQHKFLYIGNFGIAQELEIFTELANELKENGDVAFVFVGSGALQAELKKLKMRSELDNFHIFDAVPAEEVISICEVCDYGIVALNIRHMSHNIPGKFLTYIRAKLPVLARVNGNNDLVDIIEYYNVGVACCSGDVHELLDGVSRITSMSKSNVEFKTNCDELFKAKFETNVAVRQILRWNDARI